jgi:hypothetical protein
MLALAERIDMACSAAERERLENLLAHAVDHLAELDKAILAEPAQTVLGVAIKTVLGWFPERDDNDASGLIDSGFSAALADVRRLTGIDLLTEYEAVPGCGVGN